MQVALFGGSFDPPHVAHVLAAAYLLSVHGVDRVVVVPVYAHAFDKHLTAFEHRVAMCRLAMSILERVEVSEIERRLGSPSRTLRTVEQLSAEHPEWTLRLAVGADVLADAHKWLAFDEITRKAPLIVLGRAGSERADAPPPLLPRVSSTRVRALLARTGDADARAELEAVVPRDVRDYIEKHELYR